MGSCKEIIDADADIRAVRAEIMSRRLADGVDIWNGKTPLSEGALMEVRDTLKYRRARSADALTSHE